MNLKDALNSGKRFKLPHWSEAVNREAFMSGGNYTFVNKIGENYFCFNCSIDVILSDKWEIESASADPVTLIEAIESKKGYFLSSGKNKTIFIGNEVLSHICEIYYENTYEMKELFVDKSWIIVDEDEQ